MYLIRVGTLILLLFAAGVWMLVGALEPRPKDWVPSPVVASYAPQP